MSKRTRPSDAPTGAQLEILEAVSATGKTGVTAAQVWAKMNAEKPVARTTIITLIQRLEARGWVVREGEGRGAIYRSTHGPEEATAHIADGFLARYFQGSASRLVLNLLGEGRLSAEEIRSLRELLKEAES